MEINNSGEEERAQNWWYHQYLESEKLWYLTEHHPEDGIWGEHFFEENETDKMNNFIKENNITFKK